MSLWCSVSTSKWSFNSSLRGRRWSIGAALLALSCMGLEAYADGTVSNKPLFSSPEPASYSDRGLTPLECSDYLNAPPITFTGDVEKDFTGGFTLIQDNYSRPGDIGQPSWMTKLGRMNGWDVKDIRLAWDKTNDVLFVGINFFGVAGDADGNGVVGIPKEIGAYWDGTQIVDYDSCKGKPTCVYTVVGSEWPMSGRPVHFDGSGSGISIGIGPNEQPAYATRGYLEPLKIMAGLPHPKSQRGSGPNGFTVAKALRGSVLGFNFGDALPEHMGSINTAGPDIEFTIRNFSKLPGIDVKKGIGITFVAGSTDDMPIGEDYMPYYPMSCIRGRR